MNSTNFESFFPEGNSPPHLPPSSLPPPRKRRLLLPDSFTQNAKAVTEDTIEDFDSPPRTRAKRKLRLPDGPPPPNIHEQSNPIEQDFRIQQPEPQYQDHGVECIRVSDVFENTPFQFVFPYPQFNAMQSQCFLQAYRSDDSLVVSAPTGGGKTVIFELAICRVFSQNGSQSSQKVLYVAPLKALVQERKDDWTEKFQRAGLKCTELTSDTSETLEWEQIRTSEILLCTPEKWDQLTRKNNASELVSNISLVLLDEVHILTESRGACLEAIVTRMKLWSHRNVQEGKSGMRFIAVSATCPNLVDIGHWLRVPPDSGVKIFGKEYRPVPLNVVVERVQEAKNQFLWDRNLKFRLYSTIQRYSDSQPTLVFCSSRKSASEAALQIISDSMGFIMSPTQAQALRSTQIKDKSLGDCILHGVGFYHAALSTEDRRAVQHLFLSGHLRVVCSTSGLAMGVNLPAHLVIICGTKFYRSSSYVDIDSITIMQMIGRAGRPQFDTSAIAVVLTDASGDKKYRNMIEGQETVESSLHHSLAEHFNSEIVLRTIRSMEDAIAWVKCTFLHVRLQLRPEYYQDRISSQNLNEDKLEEWVRFVLDDMRAHGLILESNGELFATKLGKTLCNHRTNYATMKLFTQMDRASDFYTTLRVLCSATEFEKVVLRRGEKKALNELNKNKDIVKYSVGKLVRDSVDKVCVLFQAFFSGHKFEDWGLRTEAGNLLPPSLRIIRCMITFFEEKKFGTPLLHAIRLSQCLDSHMWHDSTLVCRQLEGIGATLAKNLSQGNIVSFRDLESANPRRIESLLKRNPPAGNLLQANLEKIWPKILLTVQVAIVDSKVEMIISVQSENISEHERHKFRGIFSRVLVLQERKNLLLFTARTKNFCMRPSNFNVQFPLSQVEDDPEVIIYVLNENYVGMDVSQAIHLMEDELSEINDGPVEPKAIPKEKKKEDNPNGLCKHVCKHKDKCKHACCKKWLEYPLPVTPTTEKKQERKNPELDLLRKKVCAIPTAEQTMNHLTPDPPVESSEISQQIASYREEIDFLNQGGSPQLTHKEPEMFASKKETPSETPPCTEKTDPLYYPRKQLHTPPNFEVSHNKRPPFGSKTIAPYQEQQLEYAPGSVRQFKPKPPPLPPPNQRPTVPLSRGAPWSQSNNLSQYLQQKQENPGFNSYTRSSWIDPRTKSAALTKYCQQMSRPPIVSDYRPSNPPPSHWKGNQPDPPAASYYQHGGYPPPSFHNQSQGMGQLGVSERWGGEEYERGGYVPDFNPRGGPGRASRGDWMERGGYWNRGSGVNEGLSEQGEEERCSLSHEEQMGKFCPECGKRLR